MDRQYHKMIKQSRKLSNVTSRLYNYLFIAFAVDAVKSLWLPWNPRPSIFVNFFILSVVFTTTAEFFFRWKQTDRWSNLPIPNIRPQPDESKDFKIKSWKIWWPKSKAKFVIPNGKQTVNNHSSLTLFRLIASI